MPPLRTASLPSRAHANRRARVIESLPERSQTDGEQKVEEIVAAPASGKEESQMISVDSVGFVKQLGMSILVLEEEIDGIVGH